ncbi:MAG: hypothetical protein EOM12_02120 [Verrucomicrobiae bacterium]|nr:hypothetical protein [Verrucomicrobiae bacterium]
MEIEIKTQSEMENEFAQIENEASLILKNIRGCIDKEEEIPEDTRNKYRETCAGLQKKREKIYFQRYGLLDERKNLPEKDSPQWKALCDKAHAIDEDSWRVQSMLCEIDSMLEPDAINIPQKYVNEVIAKLDEVLDNFRSFIWEPDESYREFLKNNGLLYTIPAIKERSYIDSKFEEFEAGNKRLRDAINDYTKKYRETNDAGTRESLLGWFDSDINKLKIEDFVYKYLRKIRLLSDASLHNIQFFRACLAKNKDSIINLKISKINEEKTERDAHDNENNVNFSLVIKDKVTGKALTSGVAGGYPLGVEGILDTFKLDGDTNEQFKFKLEVEVTKTKRQFCWHDYEDLIQYFQFNQPLARKGEKRELTRSDIKSAAIDAIREEGIIKAVKNETERGIAANAKGFEKVGGIFKYLSDAQQSALKAKIEEIQRSPNPYLRGLPTKKAETVLGWCALYQINGNNLTQTAKQVGASVSTLRDNLKKMGVYKAAAKSGNKGGHKQLSKKHNLSRREQERMN